MLAQQAREGQRTAKKNDLFSITYCLTSTKGTDGLTPLGRAWLAFYLALVRQGFVKIIAPMAAISHAQFLAFGAAKSLSSAYRAHTELEKHGFITRQHCRLGENSKNSIININTSRFSFWLQGPKKLCDTNPHLPKKNTDKLTSKSPKLQTSNLERLSFKSLKSKKHANNNGNRTRFDSWHDPRLYTVGLVLGMNNAPDRPLIYKRANAAIAGQLPGFVIPWTADQWYEMTHQEREHLAARELIPLLRAYKKTKSSELLNKTIAAIAARRDLDSERAQAAACPAPRPPSAPLDPPRPPPVKTPPMSLDENELAMLRAARDRARIQQERIKKQE